MRFTYPENPQSRIQIDLARRVGGTSTRQFVERVDNHTIRGWMHCPPEGGGWGNGSGKANYTVYFYTTFSRPLVQYGVWSVDIPDGMGRKLQDVTSPEFAALVANAQITRQPRNTEGEHLGFFTEFPTAEGDQVLVKTAISFVSMEKSYYNHANEPVHHVPFLFNRLGAPWLTQYWTRRICAKAYRNDLIGLCGNEDVGQMSAWYVLASMGFHPLCPGETRYELTAPVFDSITIKLDPRYAAASSFTITTEGNGPDACYIRSATLNGEPYNLCYLDHSDITAGGHLHLILSPTPNPSWGQPN